METSTIIGIIAGILTSCSMLPQLIKAIRTRDTKDLSTFMVVLLAVGLGMWVYYGFLRDDMPIIFTNSFAFAVNLTLLFLHLKFKENGHKRNS